jgi:hypothetical protein
MVVALERLDKGRSNGQTEMAEKIVGFAYADEDEGCHTQMSLSPTSRSTSIKATWLKVSARIS